MTALSQFFVSRSFSRKARQLFVSLPNPSQKHFIAATFKVTVMRHCHDMTRILADRCGAQGMFEVNQIMAIHVSRITRPVLSQADSNPERPEGRRDCRG